MTRPDLEAIRKRLEAATEGPWIAVVETPEFGTVGTPVAQHYFKERLVIGLSSDWGDNPASPEQDMDFLAHSWEDVRDLLCYVEELEARLPSLEWRAKTGDMAFDAIQASLAQSSHSSPEAEDSQTSPEQEGT